MTQTGTNVPMCSASAIGALPKGWTLPSSLGGDYWRAQERRALTKYHKADWQQTHVGCASQPRGRRPANIFLQFGETVDPIEAAKRVRFRASLRAALFRMRDPVRFAALFIRPVDESYWIRQTATLAYALEMLTRDRAGPAFLTRNGRRHAAPDYQLRRFGEWLLLMGAPGSRPAGPKPDPGVTRRMVCALYVASCFARGRRPRGRPSRRNVAQAWYALFNEPISPDIVKARMPAAQFAVSGFIKYAAANEPDVAFTALDGICAPCTP